jgi:hypothetical protein
MVHDSIADKFIIDALELEGFSVGWHFMNHESKRKRVHSIWLATVVGTNVAHATLAVAKISTRVSSGGYKAVLVAHSFDEVTAPKKPISVQLDDFQDTFLDKLKTMPLIPTVDESVPGDGPMYFGKISVALPNLESTLTVTAVEMRQAPLNSLLDMLLTTQNIVRSKYNDPELESALSRRFPKP